MIQHGATEEEAIEELWKQATSAWKGINEECLYPVIVYSIFTSLGVGPSSCLVDKILLELSSLRSKAHDLIR
jgi:hypothetical protein